MNHKNPFTAIHYKRISELISKIQDLNYAIIKGEPLSVQAYGATGYRFSSDIDILISRKDLKCVETILQENDFISTSQSRFDKITILTSSHQVTPWIKNIYPWNNIIIDLNFDIYWGEYDGKRIGMIEFLSDVILMEVHGYKVKTLPLLKAMTQLILHHYKEMNSIYHLATHNCINYNMFKDVYYLWKNNQEAISLDNLYAISSEFEIIPFVYHILYFTNWIFNDSELRKYVNAFKTKESTELLDYYGLDYRERKPWKVNFETRLEAENMYELIKDDLTDADIEKLERNRRIFG